MLFRSSVNARGSKGIIAFTFGKPTPCQRVIFDDGFFVDDGYAIELACYDGKVYSTLFEEKYGLHFAFERLLPPKGYQGVGKEFASFSYIFSDYIFRVYGYKVSSNYDPEYTGIARELSAAELLREGETEYAKGNFSAATRLFAEAVEIDSTNSLAYYRRGVSRYSQNDYEGALVDLERSIGLDQTNASAYFHCGLIKNQKYQYEEALYYFDKTLELEPNNSSTYRERAMAKLQLLDFNGANKDYDKAVALNPNNPYNFASRGSFRYLFINDYLGAIEDFDRAIEIDAGAGFTISVRGDVKHQMGDSEGACTDWHLALENGHMQALSKIGRAHV